MKRDNDTKPIQNVIPPKSIVELVASDKNTPLWFDRIGRRFRIGYYSQQDGLDVIWLVDDDGNYCETIDHQCLEKYFSIIKLSNCTNYYGLRCRPLGPISKRSIMTKA